MNHSHISLQPYLIYNKNNQTDSINSCLSCIWGEGGARHKFEGHFECPSNLCLAPLFPINTRKDN